MGLQIIEKGTRSGAVDPEKCGLIEQNRLGTRAVEQVEEPAGGRVGEFEHDGPAAAEPELHAAAVAPQRADAG